MITLYNGDCLEVMKRIPDGSVDLVLTDPPYGTIKGLGATDQAKAAGYRECEWDTEIPVETMFSECARIIRQNGKCILFSQEPYTSKIITKQIASLPFSYRAIWIKNVFGNKFMCNKAMVSRYEDVCVFQKASPKHDFESKHPLREYFKRVLEYIGLTSCKEINAALGHRRAEHSFYVTGASNGSTQFSLCTEQTYEELVNQFGIDMMDGFMPFAQLGDINTEYRTDLIDGMNRENPSVFNLWQGGKSKSNVLEYPKDSGGYHPTQKPVALLEDLIQTYSNEGDTVLDFTMGSGSTGVACINTGRNFIGIELDEGYYKIAQERIEAAKGLLFNLT